jgi:hypothetical protein
LDRVHSGGTRQDADVLRVASGHGRSLLHANLTLDIKGLLALLPVNFSAEQALKEVIAMPTIEIPSPPRIYYTVYILELTR